MNVLGPKQQPRGLVNEDTRDVFHDKAVPEILYPVLLETKELNAKMAIRTSTTTDSSLLRTVLLYIITPYQTLRKSDGRKTNTTIPMKILYYLYTF